MTKKTRSTGETHAGRIRRERGVGRSDPPEPDLLTPDETLDWLRDEVIAVSKAAEMRIREATVIAMDYAKGKISPEEADTRSFEYSRKWGDAVYGVPSVEGMTDAQILRAMDDVRKELRAPVRPEGPPENGKNKGPSR